MTSAVQLAPSLVETRPAGHRSSALAALVLPNYVLLCIFSVLPFIMIEQPPIVDFANHAARLFLACNPSNPAVADMYQYRLGIIPNLAVDLVNRPLCGIVSPAGVLRAVTAGSLILIYASLFLIQRKLFGRATAFLLLVPAIALNLVTTMGYINFLSGIAVAMFLIAFWIGREQRFKTLVAICNVGGLIIFFCHIFALLFALLFFFGAMLARTQRTISGVTEAGLRTAALFALPLGLIAFVPSERHGHLIDYAGKVRLILAPFMTQHAGVGIFGIALLAPLYLLVRNRFVEIHPSMRLPLIVLAAFVVAVPSGIQNAVDVDSRILVAVMYLLFAALQPIRQQREVASALAAISMGLAAIQVWTMVAVWQPFSREVAEFRRSTAILPREAKVLSVVETEARQGTAYPLAYSHLTSYATIDRLIFNPLEFSGVGMQPLSSTAKFAAVDTPAALPFTPQVARALEQPTAKFARHAEEGNAGFALHWPDKFDYVVYYHLGRGRNFDPAVLTEVERGSFFSILKVKKPAA